MRTIGRRDHIDLPQLGLNNIEAKVDTGAYGCTLHCHHIEVVKKKGIPVLSFMVLDPEHPEYDDKVYWAETFSEKTVKSSTGEKENRYTIKTELVLFNKRYKVEFSLTNRKKMRYPVLIGRRFLTKRFIVDVRQKDLSFNQKKKS